MKIIHNNNSKKGIIDFKNKDVDSFLPRKNGSKTVELSSSINSILPPNYNYVNNSTLLSSNESNEVIIVPDYILI